MSNNLFPYPGNKASHADWIAKHMPEHNCYVEAFGGAAGVLFNKPKSKVEIYNDLDGDLVHFFEVLRDRVGDLTEWLEHTPFSRQLHEEWSTEFYDGERPDDDIERAGQFFYLRYPQFGSKYYGTSGFSGTCHRNHAKQYRDKVDALHKFADRFRDVTIECCSWEKMFETYDKPDTLFYLDPPYEGTEYNYGEDSFEHRDLYEAICDLQGKCILSYDSVPHWYGDGFQVQSKQSYHRIDNKGGAKDATEYLIMNFDAGGEPLMSDVGQQGLEAFTDGGEAE